MTASGVGCAAWFFDGACAGDCSSDEADINALLGDARSCTTDAECATVDVSCSALARHCSGVAYVNPALLDADALGLEPAGLRGCGSTGCALCDAMAPPARCSPEGFCAGRAPTAEPEGGGERRRRGHRLAATRCPSLRPARAPGGRAWWRIASPEREQLQHRWLAA